MNRTDEPGRTEADEQRSRVLTEVARKVICGQGTIEMVDRDNRISRDYGENEKKVMDKRIIKSSGPGRNLV